MNNKGMIRSILDTDLYKLTMMQAIMFLFPNRIVRYLFINRGKTQFPIGFDSRLRQELKKMEELSLTEKEESFLYKLPFFKRAFVEFLRGYKFDSSEVGVTQNGGELTVTIQGYWYRTVLWEVPLMALISELYFEMTGQEIEQRNVRENKNIEKGKLFYQNSLKVADFGTRRRYSFDNQLEVVTDLKSCFGSDKFLVGTSNVFIAMELGLTPIGTHAHEWFMFHAVEYGYTRANFRALENWVQVYEGDLGIALSDTFTTEDFFRVFDKKFAKLFDGVRHDSGDPFEFADKVVAHYKKLGIDPSTKTIVFSDGLNPELAVEIYKYCNKLGINFADSKIRTSFGIGTNLTNDVGVKPLNIVIKITQVLIGDVWVDTVKLSDNPGKHTGTPDEIDLCKRTLRLQNSEKLAEVQ
jgi:nicotinate phosphoribosyltransferase